MGEDMAFCIVVSFWSLEEVRITQCLRYFVGCNNLGMFPFPRYDTSYPEAVSSELLAIYRLKRRDLLCWIQFETAWGFEVIVITNKY